MKTTKQRVEQSCIKHPDWTDARRADALNLTVSVIRQFKTAGLPTIVTGKPTITASGKTIGKSVAEFRAQYDKSFIVPRRVNECLKRMGTTWEYEVNFAQAAGVSTADLSNFRDQYADHIVNLKEGRRIWAGTRKLAETLRSMI